MRALLALSLAVALGSPPVYGQSTVSSPSPEAHNAALLHMFTTLDADPPSTAALKAAQAAYVEAQGALAAYLQGKPGRRGAPTPAALRALLDPTAGAFVVVRGTLWLRPEHHERLARAARAVGDQRLAQAHENAAEAARP